MSEKLSPKIDRKTKVASALTALMIAGGVGVAAKRGMSAGESFKTDIPVPSEVQPHINYRVNPGDTEGSIAAKFNLTGADNLDYENMLNKQLPSADQHSRTLQPGEELRLPPVTG